MSLPLTPYERWDEGTQQNSIPANNNSLRSEIFNTDGVADDVDAQPGSPSDGDWYIMTATPSGSQWGGFSPDSVAIFYGGTWYEFVPAEGNKVTCAGVIQIYTGSGGWEPITVPAAAAFGSITGSPFDQSNLQQYSIVTEGSPFTANPGVHDGILRYNRCAADITFDNAEPYTAGMVFNIRATAAIDLIEDGVTLTPPAGGSLSMESDMAVQVVMTSATAGDVIGQTVASS